MRSFFPAQPHNHAPQVTDFMNKMGMGFVLDQLKVRGRARPGYVVQVWKGTVLVTTCVGSRLALRITASPQPPHTSQHIPHAALHTNADGCASA